MKKHQVVGKTTKVDSLSWMHCIMLLYSVLMNLCNKAKHNTISRGCYAGVQFIPATSLVMADIIGPRVTAINKFHCNMLIFTCTCGTRNE